MLFAILILLLFLTANSTAQDNCPSSSCGNVKISYPFRLTSSPKSCGYDDSGSELECHNNETIFKVGNARYIVRDINYATYSIWMVDPSMNTANANLSSCPLYPNDLPSWPYLFSHNYFFDMNRPVSFLHCLAPVSSSSYVEAPFCGNRSSILSNSSRLYSYVVEGDGIVEDSCMLDHVVWSSRAKGTSTISNPSLAGIYGDLSNGVELSWFIVHCGDCPRFTVCLLEDSRITCKRQCQDDVTTLSQQGFRCQLEYWGFIYGAYTVVAYGGLIGLRFVIGFVLLMVLVVFQWRKRHDLPL
ncbi:uncharacterized protein LOC121798323 [Salvia splendens]|uniref:uncharacterized protein LOC121798323 n=1 Tax=Salvia splendens TaxID=180675 RepID=UPI001C2800D5|nr:uncharacterized protein LOC121798323 [Salvia splendens]